MTTQQQTERDEREMLARWLTDTLEYVQNPENVANRDRLLALLRGDEPAKPVDPVVEGTREILAAWMVMEASKRDMFAGNTYTVEKNESFRDAVAVMRRLLSEAEARGRESASAPTIREINQKLGNFPTSRSLMGDEPAKLDRYVVAWQEADSAFGHCDCDRRENCPHAAAVLRKHFEPSAEVVEAAREIRAVYSVESNLTRPLFLMADFILKGDQ